jgi:hypothetical protein
MSALDTRLLKELSTWLDAREAELRADIAESTPSARTRRAGPRTTRSRTRASAGS